MVRKKIVSSDFFFIVIGWVSMALILGVVITLIVGVNKTSKTSYNVQSNTSLLKNNTRLVKDNSRLVNDNSELVKDVTALINKNSIAIRKNSARIDDLSKCG